jgi:hypothetical protein
MRASRGDSLLADQDRVCPRSATFRREDPVTDEVILDGGRRDGLAVPLSAMTRDGISKYVLQDDFGVYRHDEESLADFRDEQRVAVFEPFVPGVGE